MACMGKINTTQNNVVEASLKGDGKVAESFAMLSFILFYYC